MDIQYSPIPRWPVLKRETPTSEFAVIVLEGYDD